MNRNTLFLLGGLAAIGGVVAVVAMRSRGTGLDASTRRTVADAVESAYFATLAALDPSGASEDEFSSRDQRASAAADALRGTFESVRQSLNDNHLTSLAAFADQVASAQLQIAAFAINRKNRGLPDSAQMEAERDDRDAFRRNAMPLFDRLVSAFS